MALSIVLFVGACFWAGSIQKRAEILQTEVESKLSAPALIVTVAKSFWDGFTFGIFEEEGKWAEYKKAEKWEKEIYTRFGGAPPVAGGRPLTFA